MLVLASKSPRRRQILREAGIPFTVRAAEVPEVRRDGEDAEEYVRRLAWEKAAAVPAAEGEIILAADTVVVLDGEILEKPASAQDAARMLRQLSGRNHAVLTGICLKQGDATVSDCATTIVGFAPLSEDEIASYVLSGEPADKAGAYGIQGLASKFVERIEGCYFNVVGLPVALVYKHLRRLEWDK
jgi:septum formation protein